MEEKNRIIIFGIGYFGFELIKVLVKNWKVIAVDINEEKLKRLKEKFTENVETIKGDASSILTWKKIEFENLKHIIITVKDGDVSFEACRIAREVFNLETPITVFLYELEKEEEFLKLNNINIVKPASIIVNSVVSLIEKNYKIATNIGLGKGEIIEVKILAKSHFVDRKLKYLRPSKWRIAAIYRDGQLIIPSGRESIKVGDSVVLIGDPKVLENLVSILLKGIPQFPLQFGSDIALPLKGSFLYAAQETSFLYKNTKTNKVLIYPYSGFKPDEKELENLFTNYEIKENIDSIYWFLKETDNNIAFYVIPFNGLSFLERLGFKKFFEKSKKPFLVSKGKFPYKNVAVMLNAPDPAFVLEIGVEISRLLKVDINTFYVAMPKELRTEEEEENLLDINNVITDFENIYKKSMNFKLLEGNPVRETLKYLENFDSPLVVMSYKKQNISFFNPVAQYLIAKKCRFSSFLIPVEEVNE